MTLHFMHIGKTGGTALKVALRRAGLAYWHGHDAEHVPETPFGRIQLHHHRFRLHDVPAGDFVFFCVRDPISRFFSAYYSRLAKGRPRYFVEWSEGERRAFEAFPTPQQLAAALGSDDREERARAEAAMASIRHLGSLTRFLGTPWRLRRHLPQIAYVARQETLSDDWERLKRLLGLPPDVELPRGPRRSHRRDPTLDKTLDPAAAAALKEWYARDYRLIRYCERLRLWRGWVEEPAPERALERLRLYSAMALPAPVSPRHARRLR
jgi:hypothetical protein